VTALLEVEGLRAGYDGGTVLHGIDLTVAEGQALALLGRNGAGKSTLLSAVMGLVRPTAGSVRLQGRELAGRPANQVARAGVALVPQGRRVFADLTVDQNLQVASGRRAAGPWTPRRVYEVLPQLAERRRHRADQLSGGEQQMLAIARALLLNPRLLLLDEPSDGLAPTVVARVAGLLSGLRDQGLSILLVEQDLRTAFSVAGEIAVMGKGVLVHRSPTTAFRGDAALAARLLGVRRA
jgi:branched-chain amino acid transport system ATP-binding protein